MACLPLFCGRVPFHRRFVQNFRGDPIGLLVIDVPSDGGWIPNVPQIEFVQFVHKLRIVVRKGVPDPPTGIERIRTGVGELDSTTDDAVGDSRGDAE